MRLRWMETSEAHSIPLHIWHEKLVGTTTNAQNKQKEVLHADGPHTRLAAARLFLRVTNGRGYYPFPEAEEASKYREETYVELILKLTRPRQEMPPYDGLGPTMCV